IVDGETTRVLLDVDLTHTFHPIPANDPLNATRYSLHPVIHVTNLGSAGGTVPVENATVYVLPPGQTDPAESVAATPTNAQGEYTVLAIAPGTYDVKAIHGTDS